MSKSGPDPAKYLFSSPRNLFRLRRRQRRNAVPCDQCHTRHPVMEMPHTQIRTPGSGSPGCRRSSRFWDGLYCQWLGDEVSASEIQRVTDRLVWEAWHIVAYFSRVQTSAARSAMAMLCSRHPIMRSGEFCGGLHHAACPNHFEERASWADKGLVPPRQRWVLPLLPDDPSMSGNICQEWSTGGSHRLQWSSGRERSSGSSGCNMQRSRQGLHQWRQWCLYRRWFDKCASVTRRCCRSTSGVFERNRWDPGWITVHSGHY